MTPAEPKFRSFKPDDTDGVVALLRSNIPKYFSPPEEAELREFLSTDHGPYYVADAGDQIIAAGGIALNKDQTVSLCWGMVRSDLIGTGLGKHLTKFRIQKALEHFGPLPLVISTSQHTQGFYQKLGFTLTQHTPDGFGPGIDICLMRLEVMS